MIRKNDDYLNDMRNNLEAANRFVTGMTYNQFENDEKTVYAVIRCFEILGEAASKLTDDFKKSHPSIPWREIITMRHKLVHEYFGVNLAVIWETISKDVPMLLDRFKDIR